MNIYFCPKCRRFKYGDGVEEVKVGDILLPERKACKDHPNNGGLSLVDQSAMFAGMVNAIYNIQDELRELIELKKAR